MRGGEGGLRQGELARGGLARDRLVGRLVADQAPDRRARREGCPLHPVRNAGEADDVEMVPRDDGEAEICADPLKFLRIARKSTSLILSFSDVQLAEFINRERAQRPLTRFVHMLNKILAGRREDRELGLMALRRMALEPAG